MPYLRLLYRAIVLLTVAITLFSGWMLLQPVGWYSERTMRRWRRYLFRIWKRVVAWSIGMQVVVKGTPPDPPFILVTNHQSYVDVFVLAHQTGCIFVARGDAEHWPIIGFIMKRIHMIFIQRDLMLDTARVNRLIDHAIHQGDCVALFAESRISRGLDVEPFKTALLQPAVNHGIPVHYATISYRAIPDAQPPSTVVSWWKPEPFWLHARRLLRNKGFIAEITFGEAPVHHEDRRVLADELWRKVRANFAPVE
ncbi:MAG: 1-acyl-sn-glycerol-3-phosphate acyltransferase [Candidatus Hydrogenedentes bacterium]|nr:1-acyl-sn-glycerol-3-phosphate acyltransferase [Candidatus Hydrogenedentota bacterium]